MTKNIENESSNNVVIFNESGLDLEVNFDFENETVWLTQLQLSQLFETSTDNVGLHLINIFNEGELTENSTTEDFSVVRLEGKRKVKRI